MDRDQQAERLHWILRLKNMGSEDYGDAVIGVLVLLAWIFIILASLLGWIR